MTLELTWMRIIEGTNKWMSLLCDFNFRWLTVSKYDKTPFFFSFYCFFHLPCGYFSYCLSHCFTPLPQKLPYIYAALTLISLTKTVWDFRDACMILDLFRFSWNFHQLVVRKNRNNNVVILVLLGAKFPKVFKVHYTPILINAVWGEKNLSACEKA